MIGRLLKKTDTKLNGNFRGKVVDVDDPLQLGRVRIRVYGVMQKSTVPTASLPWAVPAMPISNGAGAGTGSFYVPEVDTEVFLFFEQGNPMSPVYFAEAQNGAKGLPPFKSTNYPKRIGFKLGNGIQWYMDKQTGVSVFTHPSGAAITIQADGGMVVSSPANVTITGRTITLNPV